MISQQVFIMGAAAIALCKLAAAQTIGTMEGTFTIPFSEWDGTSPPECTSVMAGCTGEFVEISHDTGGTVTVLDDCTFRISQYTFDGTGPAVEWWAAQQEGSPAVFPYPANAIKVAELGSPGNYQAGEGVPGGSGEVVVRLGLDTAGQQILLSPSYNHISLWCEEFTVDFGNAALSCPMALPPASGPIALEPEALSPAPRRAGPPGAGPPAGSEPPAEPEGAPAEPEGAPAEPEGAPAEPEGAPAEPEGAPAEPAAAPEAEAGVEPEAEGPPAAKPPTASAPAVEPEMMPAAAPPVGDGPDGGETDEMEIVMGVPDEGAGEGAQEAPETAEGAEVEASSAVGAVRLVAAGAVAAALLL